MYIVFYIYIYIYVFMDITNARLFCITSVVSGKPHTKNHSRIITKPNIWAVQVLPWLASSRSRIANQESTQPGAFPHKELQETIWTWANIVMHWICICCLDKLPVHNSFNNCDRKFLRTPITEVSWMQGSKSTKVVQELNVVIMISERNCTYVDIILNT